MKMKKKLNSTEFKLMQGFMRFVDTIHPHVPVLAKSLGIKPGSTVVDYGCGPGRYTVEFARIVGLTGKVYAVDIVEIAIQETHKKLLAHGINNVELLLARGYATEIPQGASDVVCAIDMFHHVDGTPFLKEVYRITKPDGILIIAGGHQSRRSVKAEVAASGLWTLMDDNNVFMKYRKST